MKTKLSLLIILLMALESCMPNKSFLLTKRYRYSKVNKTNYSVTISNKKLPSYSVIMDDSIKLKSNRGKSLKIKNVPEGYHQIVIQNFNKFRYNKIISDTQKIYSNNENSKIKLKTPSPTLSKKYKATVAVSAVSLFTIITILLVSFTSSWNGR